MTVYDILNRFYIESKASLNSKKVDILDIASNYEYYSNIISAYIFSYYNPVDAEKYYQYSTPTFGTSYFRFEYALQIDKEHLLTYKKDVENNYYNVIKRLNNEISYFNFDSTRGFEKIICDDFIISIKTLLKLVLYIRNLYIHEKVRAFDYLTPFLEDTYKQLILFTKHLNITKSTEFIVIDKDDIYCLHTTIPTHIYRNIYSRLIELKSYPINIKQTISHNAITIDSKLFNINNIEFISFDGGIISYIPSGFKKPIEDYVEPFAISKYPITNQQFLDFLESEPQYYNLCITKPLFMKDYRKFNPKQKNAVKDCAVYFISWTDAVLYCNFLSKQMNRHSAYKNNMNPINNEGIRLPSEAEWIFAATCGEGLTYKPPLNIVCRENKIGLYHKVSPNKALYENKSGVCGMLGNINEWTNTDATVIQFKKFETFSTDYDNRKIIKGGSFATQRKIISQNYATDVSKDNLHYIGFRIAFKLNK